MHQSRGETYRWIETSGQYLLGGLRRRNCTSKAAKVRARLDRLVLLASSPRIGRSGVVAFQRDLFQPVGGVGKELYQFLLE